MLPINRQQKKKKGKWSWGKIGILSGTVILGLLLLSLGYQMIGETKQEKNPGSSVVSQVKTDEQEPEWDHKWWKEIPSQEKTESNMFQDFQVTGQDGKYHVTLKVNNDLPRRTFYYDIYVVDGFSSRLVLNGQAVTFHKDKDKKYTTVDFKVNIPKEAIRPLSGKGIAKITIYRLEQGEEKEEKDTIDNLLQLWGPLPNGELDEFENQ